MWIVSDAAGTGMSESAVAKGMAKGSAGTSSLSFEDAQSTETLCVFAETGLPRDSTEIFPSDDLLIAAEIFRSSTTESPFPSDDFTTTL